MKTYYVETKQGKVFETQNPEYWPEARKLTAKEGKEKLKQEAIKELKELLKNPCVSYTVLRHVSASGMQREISLKVIKDGRMLTLDYCASVIIGRRIGKHNGIIIRGCGMDMGFALVDNLLFVVFPGLDWQSAGYRQEWV